MQFGHRHFLSTHTVVRQLTLRFSGAIRFYDSSALFVPRAKAKSHRQVSIKT